MRCLRVAFVFCLCSYAMRGAAQWPIGIELGQENALVRALYPDAPMCATCQWKVALGEVGPGLWTFTFKDGRLIALFYEEHTPESDPVTYGELQQRAGELEAFFDQRWGKGASVATPTHYNPQPTGPITWRKRSWRGAGTAAELKLTGLPTSRGQALRLVLMARLLQRPE